MGEEGGEGEMEGWREGRREGAGKGEEGVIREMHQDFPLNGAVQHNIP